MSADADVVRRRPWRRVAIAAVAIVVVAAIGAVGVMVGRATAPGPDIVVAAAPVVEDPPEIESMPLGTAVESPSPGAGSTPQLVVGESDAQRSPFINGARALPDTPAVATGYRVVRTGLDGPAVAEALAQALGVSGAVVPYADSWLVGAADGSSASVRVMDDALMDWSYADPQAAASTERTGVPTQSRALALASTLLGQLGVDVSTVDWQVERGDNATTVVAWQLVAGQRTQLGWQVVFGPGASVTKATGFVSGFDELPGYTVVGARTAVERSTEPPWSELGAVQVRPASDDSGPSASPSPAATGKTLTVAVPRITATDARLGLAQYWQPDGELLILPSYILTATDGSEWALIGVANGYVDFVDEKDGSTTRSAGEVR